MWEFINKIVYINLDHREDRRKIMKEFFEKGQIPDDKIIRFPAIKTNKGLIGCLRSHTTVLQMAKDNGWKNVLILEDDLEWSDLENGYKQLEEIVNLEKWDVIQLVGWYLKYDFPRIYETMNAGAYLVNSSYYDTLLANRYEAIRKITSFEMLYKSPIPYTADVYWNKLSQKDNWYGLYPCICRQVDIYSDNSRFIYKQSEVNGIYPGRETHNKLFTPIQNAQQQNTASRK
jgi:glycosyl transferase, family 25